LFRPDPVDTIGSHADKDARRPRGVRGPPPHRSARVPAHAPRYLGRHPSAPRRSPARAARARCAATRSALAPHARRRRRARVVARKLAGRCAASSASLVDTGALARDPTAGIATPKLRRKLPAHLTLDDVDRLLATPRADTLAGLRDRAIFEVLYSPGSA
jgi:integrase